MLSLVNLKTHIYVKNMVLSLNPFYKRASFSSSFCMNASMTVEGSLVLPLFLLYMVTLLYGLEIVRFQSDVFEAMHHATQIVWAQAPVKGAGSQQEQADDIHDYLGQQVLPYLCVEGGKGGVEVSVSENYAGTGNILTEVSYVIRPFWEKLPIGEILIQDSVFLHTFIGYTGGFEDGENIREPYVYITSSGTKYHLTSSCTYLKVQVLSVDAKEIDGLRNGSGEIYRACEVCKPRKEGTLYYTGWGNRYHNRPDCKTLRRIVYLVPLSRVGARTPCSKCG